VGGALGEIRTPDPQIRSLRNTGDTSRHRPTLSSKISILAQHPTALHRHEYAVLWLLGGSYDEHHNPIR
jgi:hypothetical protein